jgi:hemolysin III
MATTQLGRMQHPVRGFLHGVAAIVAAVGLVAMLVRSTSPGMTIAGTVYGVALVAMYATSATYHSVPWGPDWKARLQILDHTFIYVLVAATFTPLLLATNPGMSLIIGLVGIWTVAALGLAREIVSSRLRRTIMPLQFLAASLVLFPTWTMLTSLDTAAVVLTLAGSATYILGTWLFVNDRPRLAPSVFSHHEFFHVLVIVASVLHFIAVWSVIGAV